MTSQPTPSSHASENLGWSSSLVPRAERSFLLKQNGAIVWLTGLSGSGKSTVARALESSLVHDGRSAYVLDGDNIRRGLSRDLGFSAAERHENVRRVAEVARLFADAQTIAIVALITPYATDRTVARNIAAEMPFVEVHVHADLSVCETRDPKGLYRKARAGTLKGLTGIDAPYEVPDRPDLMLDTAQTDVAGSVQLLRKSLETRGVL